MNKFIFLCLMAFLSFCSQAEILTFEEALATARRENWDLQMVQGKYMQAHSLVGKTLAAYLPKISAGGSYTRNNKEGVYRPDTPERSKKIVISPLESLGIQAQVSQMLISPWLISQLANLNKYSQVTRFNKEQARRDVLFSVAQLYYAVAANKEAIKAQEQLLATRIAHEKDIKLRFDQGYVIEADVLQAQIETSQNEQDLTLAQNAHEAAKLSLAAMLNRNTDFDITEPPSPRRPNAQELEITSINNNRFDLKAALFQSELANRVKNSFILRYLPDLSAMLQYKGSNKESFGGNKHSFSFILNLNWNIFDGGLREAEANENSGKALEAKAIAHSRSLNVHKDIEIAKLDLSSAEANREKALKQVELAREQFRLVKASHQRGAATDFQFSNASNALATAEIAFITQNLNVNLAALKLQHELGIFE